MDAEKRHLLYECIEPLRAKEQLSLIAAITLATGGGPDGYEMRQRALIDLVTTAHEGTDEELAREIEPLTRRSR